MDEMYALIERLAVNEDKVMELYSVFGDKFQEHREFWKGLSGEEKRHASLLREFGKMAEITGLKPDLSHVKNEMVEDSIRFVCAEIKRARKGEIDCGESFKVASELEKGMLESGSFEAKNSDEKDLVKLFRSLNTDTSRHFEVLKNKCGNAV